MSLGRRILVVDKDPRSRTRIACLLERLGYATYEATTGEEALAEARREQPLLVVLEVDLPVLSGYEVCRELRDEFGEGLPIVFVSGNRTKPSDEVAGLLLGADDYIPKQLVSEQLLARVRRLMARSTSKAPSGAAALTTREQEVLAMLSRGLDQVEIARELSISPKTVAKHIEHVLSKLGVHSRAQAVALAVRRGQSDALVTTPGT